MATLEDVLPGTDELVFVLDEVEVAILVEVAELVEIAHALTTP